jgi:hypothetical protein
MCIILEDDEEEGDDITHEVLSKRASIADEYDDEDEEEGEEEEGVDEETVREIYNALKGSVRVSFPSSYGLPRK